MDTQRMIYIDVDILITHDIYVVKLMVTIFSSKYLLVWTYANG